MFSDTKICSGTFDVVLSSVSSTAIKTFLAFDVPIAILTILGNCIFIFTLLKTRSLQTPSNMLLGALCLSDLLVGFIVQPLYASFLVRLESEHIIDKSLCDVAYSIFYLCGGLSFLYAIAVSIDRYIAICHPFIYHAKATCRKHMFVASIVGLLWGIFAGTEHLLKERLNIEWVKAVYSTVSGLAMLFCYGRIFHVIHKQKRTIVTMGTLTTEKRQEISNRRQERDKTKTIAIITGLFVICYSPYMIFKFYNLWRRSFCWDSQPLYTSYLWMNFSLFLNSVINPVVYYVRSKEIRVAAKKLISMWIPLK